MNFNAITLADRIKTGAGTLLVVLLAVGSLDISPVVNGIIAGAAGLLLALGVKPLGPAA